MLGRPESQGQIYFAIDIESWVRIDHPLRGVKARADAILRDMRPEFRKAYAKLGRPSIPPELLLKALLLKALYSIRSEVQLVSEIQFNLLYRWFLDLSLDAPVWEASTLGHNRERFEKYGLVRQFFDRVVASGYLEEWMSGDHFSVDGSLIQSYGSMKSLRPIDTTDVLVRDGADDDDPGNPTVRFRGEKRTNETHRSLVDPDARLARKGDGQPSVLAHAMHLLTENRHGLIVDVEVTEANGFAERETALLLIERAREQHEVTITTLAGDKGYDAGDFLLSVEQRDIEPMIPIREGAIRSQSPEGDARRRARRRQRTRAYKVSQRCRKLTEEGFGWTKEVGGMRRSRHIERWKIGQNALLACAAFNLLRMVNLSWRE